MDDSIVYRDIEVFQEQKEEKGKLPDYQPTITHSTKAATKAGYFEVYLYLNILNWHKLIFF